MVSSPQEPRLIVVIHSLSSNSSSKQTKSIDHLKPKLAPIGEGIFLLNRNREFLDQSTYTNEG